MAAQVHATIALALATNTANAMQLEVARALAEERRAALHYVIYPDEGRTGHPAPDAE